MKRSEKLREIKGYSQAYMAQRLKMSQNNYSRIELDQNKLNLDRLQEISTVLEVDPMDILNFDERYIFHSTSHSQTGGETKSGIFNNECTAWNHVCKLGITFLIYKVNLAGVTSIGHHLISTILFRQFLPGNVH